MRRFPVFTLLLCLLAPIVPFAAETGLRSFGPGSLADIKQEKAGQPFILTFWSLDCASCMQEMDALAASIAKHPKLKLVLIATDDEDSAEQVEAMLKKHRLASAESWIFSGTDAQRLRYEVDPTWFGELPRSYFYDASHQRIAHSGALNAEHIEAWLKAVTH